MQTGRELCRLERHLGKVLGAALSPDGQRLVTAGEEGTLKVWSLAPGQLAVTMWGHSESVCSLAFSPDGRRLASASNDKAVQVYDARPME
jgi:WD40 repeat protein